MGEDDKNVIEETEMQENTASVNENDGNNIEETVVQENTVEVQADTTEAPANTEEVKENPATEEPEMQETAATKEKDVHAQMEDYLRKVCVGIIPKGSSEHAQEAYQQQQRALSEKLHLELQQITNTEVALNSMEEEVLLSDLRVYDKKKDRFVMLSELSDPPAFLTGDSKVSFDLVSKLLMEGHSFFLPKWKTDGQMDMDDPIMIGGGFVNGDFYLKVDDAARANEHAKLQEPLQKPGFLDRFVDLFKQWFLKERDPICEAWDRYEPFRKAEHDRVKIKKSKPLQAKSIAEDLKEAEAEIDNSSLDDATKKKQKDAFQQQAAVEQALEQASENVLSGEGQELLYDIHQKIGDHMKHLCELGEDRGSMKQDMDKIWGMLPNLRSAVSSDVPAYALFGMAIAFSTMKKYAGQETLNQTQYRALVTGNYDAIGGREGKYKDAIKEFEQIMHDSRRNKEYSAAELDDASNWEAADEEKKIIGTRKTALYDGLELMEQELLRQSDPASPWSMELGRMLECAEALSNSGAGSFYARDRWVSFYYMSPNVKGLCTKQSEIEDGIGRAPNTQEYLNAQKALDELRKAAGDYEAFLPHDMATQTRYILEKRAQWYTEKRDAYRPFENFMTKFTYGSVGKYTHLIDGQLMDIGGNRYGELMAGQVHLIAVAYSLADKYKLNGEEIRQFITGQNIRDDEKLTEQFKVEVQGELNSTDRERNQITYDRGFKKIEAELYQMEDFTSAWAHVLCDALRGCSRVARNSPTLILTLGAATLDDANPPVVSKRDAENTLLEEFQNAARKYETPEDVLKRYSTIDDKHKNRFEESLQNSVRRELSARFLDQLSKVQGAEKRLEFLRNQGKSLKAYMETADNFIHEHINEYLADPEIFQRASHGGAFEDFENDMKLRKMSSQERDKARAEIDRKKAEEDKQRAEAKIKAETAQKVKEAAAQKFKEEAARKREEERRIREEEERKIREEAQAKENQRLEAIRTKIEGAARNPGQIWYDDFRNNPNATVDDYYNTLTKMLLSDVAQKMVKDMVEGNIWDSDRLKYYDYSNAYFTHLEENLKEFVQKQVDPKIAEIAVKSNPKMRNSLTEDDRNELFRHVGDFYKQYEIPADAKEGLRKAQTIVEDWKNRKRAIENDEEHRAARREAENKAYYENLRREEEQKRMDQKTREENRRVSDRMEQIAKEEAKRKAEEEKRKAEEAEKREAEEAKEVMRKAEKAKQIVKETEKWKAEDEAKRRAEESAKPQIQRQIEALAGQSDEQIWQNGFQNKPNATVQDYKTTLVKLLLRHEALKMVEATRGMDKDEMKQYYYDSAAYYTLLEECLEESVSTKDVRTAAEKAVESIPQMRDMPTADARNSLLSAAMEDFLENWITSTPDVLREWEGAQKYAEDVKARKAEEEVKREAEEAEQQDAAVEEFKAVQRKAGTVHPSEMKSVEAFVKELNTLSEMNDTQIWNEGFRKKPGADVEDYFNSVTKLLVKQLAEGVINNAERLPFGQRWPFYASMQEFYRSVEQGLVEFVPTQFKMERVERAVEADKNLKIRDMWSKDDKDEVLRNGLKNYYKSVEALNAANRQQRAKQKSNQPQKDAPAKDKTKGGMVK